MSAKIELPDDIQFVDDNPASPDQTVIVDPFEDEATADRAEDVAEVEPTPVTPDPNPDEVERLLPDPSEPFELQSGLIVEIVPLKLRETMKLLKIITRGAGSILESFMSELDMDDPDSFAQTLGALIVMSIPEAENEVVDFVQSMVQPVGFEHMNIDQKRASLFALAEQMANPEPEDFVDIVERVVRRESEDIRKLGKRISVAFQMTRKVTKPAVKK